jgi:putative spermidine/putrescine transport system substrate-binding protein
VLNLKRITLLVFVLMLCSVMLGAVAAQDASDEELLGTVPGYETWAEVLAAAEGTTVNWFMWGGDDKLNTDVDTDIGARVQELYGITLNRVPLTDTADAVNKVLDEAAAGLDTGTIDLIWLNGENFRTLKDADLLYGSWAESIPNAKYVDWEDPALAYDFGNPVDGAESPWGHAQFVMEYNTELVGDTPPTTFEALAEWIHANPGLFTYPAIPDFTGSVFIRHLFYWAAGGPEPFLGEFDQEVYDQYAPMVWDYLNDIKPDLWRAGETYPDATTLQTMLANQEVAFNMGYGPANAATNILAGTYPETISTFVFDTGTISNNNFVTIPFNAPNPAGAMVVANYMLSEEYQLALVDPERWGWLSPISPAVYSQEFQDAVAQMERHPATLASDVLAAHALPEPSAVWVTAIEQGWTENILEQ